MKKRERTALRKREQATYLQQLSERGSGTSAHHRRFHKYGLTPADYDAMHSRQRGACAICAQTCQLVVDHDHRTGRVRGLLCRNCNTALGMLGDDPDRARAAVWYLENARRSRRPDLEVEELPANEVILAE